MKTLTQILLFLLALLSFNNVYAADNEIVAANNPLIEYTGRIDFTNPLKPGFSYSGVSVRACFEGSSIGIILTDAGTRNYYNVILDKTIVLRLQTKSGLNTYNIANALKDTVHEIEIFRLTEVDFGKTQFGGFVIDKGKSLVEIVNKREHLIEFIGNSITCGYGNEGVNGAGSFGPTTENHYLTYAAITSRGFNARHLAVCKSGIGIYRNYDGPVTGSADCMPNLYQRIYLWDAAPLYKFTQKPDLICIDLGTNDFSTGKGDSALYVSRYLKFIDTLQVKNKNADILCLLGPMLGGNDLIRVRKYLKLIVDLANKKNNGKVSFFEMSQQTGSLGIGIDYHPTVAQHLKNAKELIKYISTLKSWPVLPELVLGNIKTADDIVLEFNTELQDVTGNFNGFSVIVDGVSVPVSKVYLDATDKTKIHITPTTRIATGKKATVNYQQGTVEGKNKVKLDKINGFALINNSTYTASAEIPMNDFIVFPNPSFNKTINYRLGENNQGELTAGLYDINGKLIASRKLSGFSGEIDFTDECTQIGMYIFRINTAKKEYSKVVVL
jgi:lysophospholipase L1-like esterase